MLTHYEKIGITMSLTAENCCLELQPHDIAYVYVFNNIVKGSKTTKEEMNHI